ncbi:MAG: glycosyltransferase family 4 protein, partial [Candidatus Staskawiczbacteria bacterium]|nr:glycosyltransferase family 4 protein [Candidatus Staskawiczbacteria bacterium]
SPKMLEWKKRFNYNMNKLCKSSWCFKWRSQWCERQLRKNKENIDLVLNIAGMYAPYLDKRKTGDIKYVVVCSYTMELSKKYEEWCTYQHEYKKWFFLEQRLYKDAELIFTTNDNVSNSLEKEYQIDRNNIVKIGYGLTFDKLPEFEKHYDGKTILFIGFDFKRKGGFILLEAFKRVRQQIPDARLMIVGPVKELYLIKQEGVDFLGPIKDRAQMAEYYKQASIFVMPSLCEPFGLVFLEAMYNKLPCIASTIDAMPEIIENGKTGFLVFPGDVEELSRKITILLNSPELSKSMGTAAADRVKKYFTWSTVGKTIEMSIKNIGQNDTKRQNI